jgi:hypothetical protein
MANIVSKNITKVNTISVFPVEKPSFSVDESLAYLKKNTKMIISWCFWILRQIQ